MRPVDIYCKLADRFYDIVQKSISGESETHFEYRRGFNDAIDLVYDMIINEDPLEVLIDETEGGEES